MGLGIFQGLFFLGGGTGPALIGAFLAARKEVASGALNPLHALDAAPFSDAFLAIALAPPEGGSLRRSIGKRSRL